MKYVVFLSASGVIALDALSMFYAQSVSLFQLWLLIIAISVYGLASNRIGRAGRK